MAKRVRPARHYQRDDDPMLRLSRSAMRGVARDLRASFNSLGDMVQVGRVADALRHGRRPHDLINWHHYREILKAPFARLHKLRLAAAEHGARQINGTFVQARRRVRFRKIATGLLSKAEVNYRHSMSKHRRCGECTMFVSLTNMPNIGNCTAVEGTIFASDVCDIFKQRFVAKAIGDPSGDRFAFDSLDPAVLAEVRQAQDALIQQLESDARDAIETIINDGVLDDTPLDEVAADIKDMIGLTDTQAQAVLNYQNMLYDLDPNALVRQLRNTEYDGVLQDAIDAGQALSDAAIENMVDDYIENYLDYRAATIAQTESTRAANAGLHDAYSQAIDRGALPNDAVTRQWQLADNPCPICESIPDNNPDGVGVNEDFDSDEGPISDPPVHPNCWPAGTLVSAGSGIAAVSSRWYQGNIAVVHCSSGLQFTATVNHPVLTQRGWVAASLLKHGDQVVRRLGAERLAGGMDHENVPTRIEDIARTALKARKMATVEVPLTTEHFHGDVAYGQVAKITANRDLLRKRHGSLFEQAMQAFLKMANHATARSGNLGTVLLGLWPAANSIVSTGNLMFAFGYGHRLPAKQSRIVVPTAFYSPRQKNALNHAATDLELARKLLLGSSGKVAFDQITFVQVRKFRGHVYNLQTGANHYTASGIISHNCECSVDYVTDLTLVPDDSEADIGAGAFGVGGVNTPYMDEG